MCPPVPVTEKTKGELFIGTGGTVSARLDVDGNGTVDVTVSSDEPKALTSLNVLKLVIRSLPLGAGMQTSLS